MTVYSSALSDTVLNNTNWYNQIKYENKFLWAERVATYGKKTKKDIENKRPTHLNGHLSTRDVLSKGLIFVYQHNHHRIHENQWWYRKAALLYLNTIAINVLYMDRVRRR